MSGITRRYEGKGTKLRVKDAFKEDAGRGTVRIDPETIEKLNLRTGDVLEVSHPLVNKRSAALLYPGKREDRGMGIIRIDPSIRRNLGASLDDIVEIRKIEAALGKEVTFAGLEESVVVKTPQQLARQLENRVLTKGDILSFYSMGRRVDLIVIDYSPQAEAVRIHLDTKVTLSERSHKQLISKQRIKITYDDIGGLQDEIEKIREIIDLPLKHPELFKRIGIDPPKGILLYGLPGTGKTLIARAISHQTDAYFINVNGPEIMSKFFGKSEENLRKVFTDAEKNAPAIIFIDDIDSLAPRREKVSGEVEKRMIAQLSNLMDGIEKREDIIVIGATNRITEVDTSLRRPGRFDREIEIGIPDIDGRYKILLIHTRGMPLFKDVDLRVIAEKSHGFLGADLEALVKEAAMLAIREILPEIDLSQPVPPKVLNKIHIKMEHFLNALKNFIPINSRISNN